MTAGLVRALDRRMDRGDRAWSARPCVPADDDGAGVGIAAGLVRGKL